MKRFLIYFLLFAGFAACTAEKIDMQEYVEIGREINFAGQVSQKAFARQGGEVQALDLPDGMEITVIAPGYGTGAPDQNVPYKPGAQLEPPTPLVEVEVGNTIKRSARSMLYTAWTAPSGVNMEEGTVDFTTDLELFIGAHEEEPALPSENICLGFKHLIAKLSVSVYDVTNAENPAAAPLVQNASISFPAIKKVGNVTATIAAQPKVSPGKSGDPLSVTLGGEQATVIYIPPLTPDELTMYGSFTVTVGGTNYVGSLANLDITAKSIAAGDHIITRIEINDDHTAVLQAITLAPWNTHDRNTYNRPSSGIWGVEDFGILTKLINTGAEEVEVDGEEFKLSDFFIKEDGKDVVILYTDLDMGSGMFTEPLGTEENPFSMTFDGNGYKISGIRYTTGSNYAGLFGVAHDATIKNLSLENCYFEGKDYVGGVVGKATGTTSFDYCLVNGGSVSGGAYVGGFAGCVDSGVTIHNAYVSLYSVGGTSQVGGFVGSNLGKIGNSCSILSSGISGSKEDAGGFAGMNTGIIENAFSQATFIITPTDGGCGAWVGNNGPGANTGVNKYCYWNNTCIDNGHCTNIVGNNTNVNETTGAEILPDRTTGIKYDNATGRLLNANNDPYSSLRQQLNTNITNLSAENTYLRWAKVSGKVLPVFSY